MAFVILAGLVIGMAALTVIGTDIADLLINTLAVVSPLICIACLAIMWHPQDNDRAVIVFILAGFVTVASWVFCLFRGIIRAASTRIIEPGRPSRWTFR